MQDGDWIDYRTTGFAIVVVAPGGDLVAYGYGAPPSWCTTAAAAEAWALHMALALTAFPPFLRTDCQSLLKTAAEGTAQAHEASRPLARIWKLIADSLDGNIAILIINRNLILMPAHQALSAIGVKVRSDGRLLTVVDWRANRLVDALAKLAAAFGQAPKAITRLLESGRIAVRHGAALLGVVTHAANNHKLQVERPDGTWGTSSIRDAQQPANHRKRQRAPLQAPKAPKPLQCSQWRLPTWLLWKGGRLGLRSDSGLRVLICFCAGGEQKMSRFGGESMR